MSCDDCRALLHSYIDGELSAAESMALEAHIVDCAACGAEYRALRTVVDTVRGARPVYEVPGGGRSKVQALIEGHRRRRRLGWLAACACAVAAVLACAILLRQAGRAESFEHFAALAADAHRRYIAGALPLDFRSDDGPAVSAWLGERLPFQVALPRYPLRPGMESHYLLAGARLLPFEDRNLAYVAYQVQGKPISLIITTSSGVTPSGGQVFHSGALRFHFLSSGGLQLISWSDRGLSYALVSDAHSLGPASCVICHGAESERPKFERLAPSAARRD